MKLLQVNGHTKRTKDKIIFTKVDDSDYEMLSKYKWRYVDRYILALIPEVLNGKKVYKSVSLHRFLMKCPDNLTVDHINRDRLDNQKSNLRICTMAENSRNTGIGVKNKSGYKGVHWRKKEKKWQACIRVNRKLIYLGDFKEKNDAAMAYNEAAKKYFKKFAYLNKII